MQLESSFVVSARGIIFGIEEANVNLFAIDGNGTTPLFSLFMPRNSFKAACVIGAHRCIAAVLTMRAFPKIFLTVVQWIIGMMVYLFNTSKDKPMHIDFLSFFGSTNGIEPIFVFTGAPVEQGETVKIVSIYNRILPLREWYQTVRWVRWLRNRMPLHSAFWHDLPPRRLCNAAIITQVDYAWAS